MESVEKECGALGGLFQAIVNDMKVTQTHVNVCKQGVLPDLCGSDQTNKLILLPLSCLPH